MKTWFTITNKADAPAAEIDIFDEIGIWGVTVKDFATALKSVPMDREITLRINSPGGSVFDGHAIYNLLAERREKVLAKVIGLAASMASIVMLAGRKTVAAANATVMIHNPIGWASGDSKLMREYADLLDKIRGQLVAAYAKKTGKKDEDITAAMDATTWMTAQEALAWGLVDEIAEPVQAAATFDLSRFGEIPERFTKGPHGAASTNHPKIMNKLMKALVEAGLIASADVNDEAAATQFAAAFATQKAQLKAAQDKNTDLEAKLEAANKDVAAALKARAEAAIDAAVKAGKIKDEAELKAKWVSAYIANEDATKALIGSLAEPKPRRGEAPVVTGSQSSKDEPKDGAELLAEYRSLTGKARRDFYAKHADALYAAHIAE